MPSNIHRKPVVAITGAAGRIGSALVEKLRDRYTVVRIDRPRPGADCDVEMDLSSPRSIEAAMKNLRKGYGNAIAAVIHLAAYFDFSGNPSPLYDTVNVQGTRDLLRSLQGFTVGRFIYASTMLVHKAGQVGETVSENSKIEPKWVYPESKAKAEAVIRREHGHIPFLILRLAGLYDDTSCVPTLAHQIARIYERNLKSLLYAGDQRAGQSFIHLDDMLSLFQLAVDKRRDLPEQSYLLAGEPDAVSYAELQQQIGRLIHGDEHWHTLSVPKPLAKAGAWLQEKSEPLVPDDFDHGEKPFERPFMIELASDHYALDISRAGQWLGWHPRHRIQDSLPAIIDALRRDPAAWYRQHNLVPPDWMSAAQDKSVSLETLRTDYDRDYRRRHRQNLWAPMLNIGLGFWLLSSPWTLGYQTPALVYSDAISGGAVILLACMALSAGPHLRYSRWALGVIGLWLLFAPLVFWAPQAASYLNDTLVGALIISLALLVRPFPGISPATTTTGPTIPPGWEFSPSSWVQRLPVIILAFIGFYISRYLTAYQLGHIDTVWEPFFAGAIPDEKNGTEEIITSTVSSAWPVPDAGVGAVTYMLEILTGIIGSAKRWRTMPWLVLLFGFMIIPLGAVSITFIIIQPILLNTWCTLCLIAAVAMLLQIPYSFDEIVATLDFLRRRDRLGRPWLRILFTGDTDSDSDAPLMQDADNFERQPLAIIGDMLRGGISVPWTLGLCVAIGLWLLFTRITLDNGNGMANADHLIGSLVLTFSITAFAEVMRPARFLNLLCGLALLITPFIFGAGGIATVASIVCGLALIVLTIPRGRIVSHYGNWDRAIV